ncbi:MAG: hypothetical protein ACI80I_002079 [Akkermansiaceae bacterium]|jgi:hypothetical protein
MPRRQGKHAKAWYIEQNIIYLHWYKKLKENLGKKPENWLEQMIYHLFETGQMSSGL